ncbi:uncharacterized protein LOC124171074 [Ischnura elegans]|uniref:uncharacterized protein LOC124171067 n=1 Tax=Ischnura elegans TaxID=197161 RepID=UPI001ED88601|nr:uncharacterized protein LOC124171067 [Ischnura elegans]XP_046406177.1 uncharacterized protein LOC124171074 [Ischnura elegans]
MEPRRTTCPWGNRCNCNPRRVFPRRRWSSPDVVSSAERPSLEGVVPSDQEAAPAAPNEATGGAEAPGGSTPAADSLEDTEERRHTDAARRYALVRRLSLQHPRPPRRCWSQFRVQMGWLGLDWRTILGPLSERRSARVNTAAIFQPSSRPAPSMGPTRETYPVGFYEPRQRDSPVLMPRRGPMARNPLSLRAGPAFPRNPPPPPQPQRSPGFRVYEEPVPPGVIRQRRRQRRPAAAPREDQVVPQRVRPRMQPSHRHASILPWVRRPLPRL